MPDTTRRDMRTPITLKIKFKSANLDQFIERYSVDVSRGGIFIRTKEPLAVGTQLKFEFQLQDSSSLIAGEGTVVWIREPDPTRTGVAPGMGVRFDRLAQASQTVLETILAEKTKKGESNTESRFEAGQRASASASGSTSSNAPVAEHNQFGGGDSKQTPLPRPVPGLDTPGDEFAEESTRVMQNDMVEKLAQQTRREAAQGFGEPEPTRRASADELQHLAQSAAPTLGASMTKAQGVGAAAVSAAAPAPEPVRAAPVSSSGPEFGNDVSLPYTAANIGDGRARPQRKSSPLLPVILIVGVGAAAGAYFMFRGGEEPKTKPVVAQPTPPGPGPVVPPGPAPGVDTPQPVVEAPKPPVEAPKAATLTAAVSSTPAGAKVTVDGKALTAVTPTEAAELEAGKSYDVTMSLRGFVDWKGKLKAGPNAKVEAKLVPTEKLVEVSSVPAGADVLLDGKKVGKTPYTIKKIDVSKSHALEVKRSGFVPQSRTIAGIDAFEMKGTKDVMLVALTLEADARKVKKNTTVVGTTGLPPPPGEKPVVPGEEKKPEVAPVEKPPEDKPLALPPEEKKAPPEDKKPPEEKKTPVEKPVEKTEKPAKPKEDAPAPAAAGDSK